MGRSLAGIILLSWLMLLGACLEMAPRSSVPFHAATDREARYASEVALAIKEGRRDEIAEAAANGRIVLPQMPEIWAIAPARGGPERELDALELAPGEPDERAAAGDLDATPPPLACAGGWWDRSPPADCPGPAPGAGPEPPTRFPGAIAPAAAAATPARPRRDDLQAGAGRSARGGSDRPAELPRPESRGGREPVVLELPGSAVGPASARPGVRAAAAAPAEALEEQRRRADVAL